MTPLVELLVDRLVPQSHESLGDWHLACRICARNYPFLSKRELEFVVQLARYRQAPSRKQLVFLEKLVARCRNEAI